MDLQLKMHVPQRLLLYFFFGILFPKRIIMKQIIYFVLRPERVRQLYRKEHEIQS